MNDFVKRDTPELDEAFRKEFERQRRQVDEWRARRPAEIEAGKAALKRLLPIAQGDAGQARVLARFLLGLYNGLRFPFDLTDLRSLDIELFEDCITLLRMDYSPELEVHRYIPDGGKVFEKLADDWGWTEEA